MQLCKENTLFMQKAIYYQSRLIAARGIIELTDRNLNFQVSALDSSFGLRNASIDICTITDVTIAGGNVQPAVVVTSAGKRYEFVLSKASELYDLLKTLLKNPVRSVSASKEVSGITCHCGKMIKNNYTYCPYCGRKM